MTTERSSGGAAAKGRVICLGPKKRNRHYSYDESLDEAPKLIEDEAVEVEEAVPADKNEAIERDDEIREPDFPAFED